MPRDNLPVLRSFCFLKSFSDLYINWNGLTLVLFSLVVLPYAISLLCIHLLCQYVTLLIWIENHLLYIWIFRFPNTCILVYICSTFMSTTSWGKLLIYLTFMNKRILKLNSSFIRLTKNGLPYIWLLTELVILLVTWKSYIIL